MKLPSSTVKLIEEEIAKLVPEVSGHINYDGVRYGALPLFGTIGEVWLLRADGTLWKADSDSGVPLTPLPENLHTVALVAGAERYPWLKNLLPQRPAEAVVCSECGGRGRVGPGNALFCRFCSALGWRSTV